MNIFTLVFITGTTVICLDKYRNYKSEVYSSDTRKPETHTSGLAGEKPKVKGLNNMNKVGFLVDTNVTRFLETTDSLVKRYQSLRFFLFFERFVTFF